MSDEPSQISPIRETDDEARALAQQILRTSRIAALGTKHPDTGRPHVTRIAICMIDKQIVSLVSDLSTHSEAMKAEPQCSLLIGEPGPKGDPLNHPRLSLECTAQYQADKSMCDAYVALNPKSVVYVGFEDFRFVVFSVSAADLNGGFGRAFHLTPADLGMK